MTEHQTKFGTNKNVTIKIERVKSIKSNHLNQKESTDFQRIEKKKTVEMQNSKLRNGQIMNCSYYTRGICAFSMETESHNSPISSRENIGSVITKQ